MRNTQFEARQFFIDLLSVRKGHVDASSGPHVQPASGNQWKRAGTGARGRWEYEDSRGSRVDLYRLMSVDDGFGQLRKDWATTQPGTLLSLSVDRIWFRINISSGAQYPYLKQ